MKKVFAIVLITLLLGCFPALALADTESDALNDQLAKVTLLVKNQLAISDEYSEFQGYLSGKSVASYWDLHWYGEGHELNVTADETGKIVSYYYNSYNERSYRDSYFSPAFPSYSQQQLEKAAQAFLAKVLRQGETVTFTDNGNIALYKYDSSFYLYGQIYYNNLPTPFSVDIQLDKDLKVTSFNRGDYYSQHIKDITKAPAIGQVVGAEKALVALGGKTQLKLQYVVEDYSAEQLKAVLRYLPLYNGDWVVDAKTGEIIDFNQLYQDAENDRAMGNGSAEAPAAEEAYAMDKGLTDVEQSGIAKLKDVLSLEQLDSILRAETAFGLNGFSRSYSNYYYGSETDGEVRCSLTYSMKASAAALGLSSSEFNSLGYTPYIQKYFDVDAKTGRVSSLFTSYPYTGYAPEAKISGDAAKKTGADFLAKYSKAYFAQTVLNEDPQYYDIYPMYKGDDSVAAFTYERQVNGIPFPDNYLSVGVNRVSGAIDSFSENWNETVQFDSAEGVLAKDAAVLAYNEAHQAVLQYLSKPVATTAPDYRVYAEMGYSYIYEFMLGYKLSSDGYVSGVDAKTGKALTYAEGPNAAPAYADIASSYAKAQIEKLAEYGVGFSGGNFLPAQQLTQKDMLQLLVSASYYGIIDDNGDDEYLYSATQDLGILTPAEKAPEKLITRAELAKTLVKMSGYGKTAMLTGIYQAGFADDSAIAQGDYGYIAIAKGLGIVKPDQNNRFNPNRVVNRAEAAVMFHNFLQRSI